MLASLLPGLREVRTPLALGYLWLLNFWLIFQGYLPTNANIHDGTLLHIIELAGFLGESAMLAALSFTAYLVGSIIKLPIPSFRRDFPRSILTRKYAYNTIVDGKGILLGPIDGTFLYKRLRPPASYYKAVSELYRRNWASLKTHPLLDHQWETTVHASEVIWEVTGNRDDLRTRLLASDTELYGEYDRFTAESEFRVNVTYPLAVLLFVLGFESTMWILLGLPLLLVLFWQGLTRDLEALAVLMRAVLVGRIQADYLQFTEVAPELAKPEEDARAVTLTSRDPSNVIKPVD